MDTVQLWDRTCKILRSEMNEVTYNTWIVSALQPLDLRGNTCYVKAQTPFYHQFIVPRYATLIQNALTQAASKEVSLKILTPEEADAHVKQDAARPQLSSVLNPKYTFDTFVVGNGNRFAQAACLAVAEAPAAIYNPLFLYGGVGLGKTHLMHAIGHYILSSNPASVVKYVTSETFMNELISAIQTGQSNAFREKYRSVDVLMVDDIQFIGGANSTQEEFFHTFNALHNDGKQIIISSDRPPKEIPRLEERLRSRFEWGLIADIQKPDLECRMAILRKLAEDNLIQCPEDVLMLIAERVDSNIRELEGSLNRLNAFASLTGKPMDKALCEEALREIVAVNQPRKVNCEDVLRAVSSYYSISIDDLRSTRRARQISVPRQIAMFLCRELTEASTARIGDAIGGRDHTTVLHGCEKVEELIHQSADFAVLVDDIRHKLQNK